MFLLRPGYGPTPTPFANSNSQGADDSFDALRIATHLPHLSFVATDGLGNELWKPRSLLSTRSVYYPTIDLLRPPPLSNLVIYLSSTDPLSRRRALLPLAAGPFRCTSRGPSGATLLAQ